MVAIHLKERLEDECKRCGVDTLLRAVIVSGQPHLTSERWAKRDWQRRLLEARSPTHWSAEAPYLNHHFAIVRYLAKHHIWLVRPFLPDPIKRDCIVVTVPCGDELDDIEQAVNLRLDAFRWELLQPVIVRFHTQKYNSWCLYRAIKRRLPPKLRPTLTKSKAHGSCITIHELIVSLLQRTHWRPDVRNAIGSLVEVLELVRDKMDKVPGYRDFQKRKLLVSVLGLAVESDLRPTVQLPLRLYDLLSDVLNTPPEELRGAVEEFAIAFRQLDFFACRRKRLARCAAAILMCPAIADVVLSTDTIANLLKLTKLDGVVK